MISIIIPTYNHLEDCLKPCLESIFRHTKRKDVEIIVVANGCTDGTQKYLETLQGVRSVWSDEALGYPRAVNAGIMSARGDYLVFLNNDTTIVGDNWLDILQEPFLKDEKVGVAGPLISTFQELNRKFVIFFCAMTTKKVIQTIGLLDEEFSPGGGEDIDFCIKAENAGFLIKQTPEEQLTHGGGNKMTGSFPIMHEGERTVHDATLVKDWEPQFQAHMKMIYDRYKEQAAPIQQSSGFADVTVDICTKDRYTSTLPMCIMSVITQSILPKKVIIIDDSSDRKDMREMPIFQYIFQLMNTKGIEWEVVFGRQKGQHFSHQYVLDNAKTAWVWRIDDDEYAEGNTLEILLSNAADGVGAVAGLVLDPKTMGRADSTYDNRNQMSQIFQRENTQWVQQSPKVIEVEHLYSSFLCRRVPDVSYCLELSPVAHREESIFSFEYIRRGYRLLVDTRACTWHLRNPEGGIRGGGNVDPAWFAHDDQIFKRKLMSWSMIIDSSPSVILDCGLGDSLCFLNIMPELVKKYPNFKIATFYPAVFEMYPTIKTMHPHILKDLMPDKEYSFQNIYAYLWFWHDQGRKMTLLEAYRELFLGDAFPHYLQTGEMQWNYKKEASKS